MPPYSPTDWEDGVTWVNAANLDKIEAGIVAAERAENKAQVNGYASLDSGGKVPVAQLPPMGADLDYSGDYAAGTFADGDIVIYNGVAYLCVKDTTTPPEVWPGSNASPPPAALPADTVVVAGTRVLTNRLLAGDAQPAWRQMGDGKLEWGPGGSTAPDTSLYRAGAAALATNGDLYANLGGADQSYLGNWSGNPALIFGSAGDVNLYRSAADVL